MPAPPPRVVLVEPQNPANLGFVARVLDNFGLGEFCRIGGCSADAAPARRTGAPAKERLDALRACADWSEAVAGCQHVVGFTARAGRKRAPIPLQDWPAQLSAWGEQAAVALVFGREDRGLETEEVERCGTLVSIPTAGLGSLNLSHAVAIVAHTWRQWAGGSSMPTPPGTGPESRDFPPAPVADQADRIRLAEQAAQELEASGFRDPELEVEACLRRLSALPIAARDLRLLERMLRHARWRREQTTPTPPSA